MRRDSRKGPQITKWWEDKKMIISGATVFALLALIIGIAVYSNNDRDEQYTGKTNPNQIISLAPENEIEGNTESASTTIGKSIEESEHDNNTNSTNVNNNTNNATTNSAKSNITNTKTTSNTTTKNQSMQTNAGAQEKKEINFTWPIKGEILKAFSIDSLLYSSTLQEWTVHNGIDIKADKTAVVAAAADGTVKSIKNDPRFGLTVIIEHENGFRTVYSNLLTAEFVVEGEKVSQGQTVGTVGNSANFEVADESHLHFEMLKDGEYVDPTMYLK